MKGHELAERAMNLRPELKVVFASGYAEDRALRPGAAWLSKPYEQRELARALDALTGRPANPSGAAGPDDGKVVPIRRPGA
jgi:two-component SAPR family response regulator